MKYEHTLQSAYTDLFQEGLNKAADFQKLALDICASQTTDLLRIWKRIPGLSSSPGALLFDAADKGVGMFVEMQKDFWDLMIRTAPVSAIKEEKGPADVEDVERIAQAAAKVADRITELVNRAELSASRQEKVSVAVQHKEEAKKPKPPLQKKAGVSKHK
jgi:hypothetical protein